MSAVNPPMFKSFGYETVAVVHLEGTSDEKRFNVDMHVQPKSGFVSIDTPIYEGDIVEIEDPRGGIDRKVVEEVNIYRPKGRMLTNMQYTEVIWGKGPVPRVAPVRRLTIEHFHPQVLEAAGALFADGHFDSAVSEAFKAIEIRVKGIVGSKQSGVKLMAEAFGGEAPKINLSKLEGQSGKDEHDGFFALFRGAMMGIRNPRAHELAAPSDPQVTLEYLAFASMLHRKLDLADGPI